MKAVFKLQHRSLPIQRSEQIQPEPVSQARQLAADIGDSVMILSVVNRKEENTTSQNG